MCRDGVAADRLRWGGAMAMLERGNGGRKRREGVSVTGQSSVDGHRECFPAELAVGTLALVRCRPEFDWFPDMWVRV